MTGRILIVDDVATNRIVMKVKLTSACYTVLQADCGSAALAVARADLPDLILLDVLMPDMTGVEVCRRLKEDPATADIPIILITALSDRANKMAGLQGGADDFLTKPVDEVTLLARVRSLLRASEIQRELRLREESYAGLGFAEASAAYVSLATVALVAPDPGTGMAWKRALSTRVNDRLAVVPREQALQGWDPRNAPDLYVIASDLGARNEGLRLLSDLRSRPASRHAAALMILPPGDAERGAVALDLGAGDILYDPFDPEELALRIETQLRRKRQSDRLRATVEAGLELAVTDSLTGLHNRRYALRRLDRMLAAPGRGVAVMMLDLDHFKAVNDSHGHAAGDAVLAEVARRLRDVLRPGDLLARLGGEEFIVALRDTDSDSALHCAERLREAVGSSPVTIPGRAGQIPVTMSVGLAMGHDRTEPGEDLIARADRALYASKHEGRNIVTLSASAA
ncbi:MAG: diguanylate cyclase response regulator [Rhodobacteraceae bacterium CG17_big_fil_post_rev_8_21_14_2_50_65_11]|nr:MAG: diguanylate cyclase response regulator [Rhodobacteraceae bacterium CG17_big_fil_post_rev_8_21_14_2_50_65_11]